MAGVDPYISSLDSSAERLSQITKQHRAIESMHWDLDRNLRQDSIKRKAERAARNLDTIQRMVLNEKAVIHVEVKAFITIIKPLFAHLSIHEKIRLLFQS